MTGATGQRTDGPLVGEGEAGSQIFAHPPVLKKTAIFTAACSALSAALLMLVPYVAPAWSSPFILVPSFLFCAGSIVWSLFILRSAGDTFEATPEGLRWRSLGKADVFLAWPDVRYVHPQNVMQRLVVEDRSGVRILVEFHLRGFGELRRIILERTPGRSAS